MTAEQQDIARISAVVSGAVEAVFDKVMTLHDEALRCNRAARARGNRLRSLDIAGLAQSMRDMLASPQRIVVGMGMIVTPDLLSDVPLYLEWWQRESSAEPPSPLKVDLNPSSLGFYDYAAAEWFEVPRRSGKRHIVGPYVDVHGTGHYLMTLTAPVIDDGQLLGVVGADVTVCNFETLLLRALQPERTHVVIVNAEDRVVMSTSAQYLTGSLLADGRDRSTTHEMPGLPWRLQIVDS